MIHIKKGISKKIILTLMMSMLVLFSGVLFACQKPADKLAISVDRESVEIYLGETPENQQTFIATVSNVSDKLAKSIHVSSDNTKTAIESVEYLGEGKTQITVKGLIAGDTVITIQSNENINKKTTVAVKNIQPVTALIEKQSTTKNYVLRGDRTFIDIGSLVEFYPSTTEQTNTNISITSGSYTDRIRIENGYLVVASDTSLNVTSVSLTIESQDRNINPLLITYDILEPFDKSAMTLSSIRNFKNLMPGESNPNPIVYLAHNEEATSTEIIRIQVPLSTKEINIEPVVTNELMAKIIQTKTSVAGGYKTLDVYLQAGNVIGADAYLYFKVSYADYGYVFSTQSFKTQIYSYDIITDIYVNNNLAQGRLNYDLFTNYANSINGLELSFEAFPTTVANEFKSFYISTNDYSATNPSQNVINLYTYNSVGALQLLTATDGEGRYIISHGQKVVVKAVSGLAKTQATILVESVFTATFYEGTEKTKQVNIDFNIHEGVNDVEFYGMENPAKPAVYLDNSQVMSQLVYFVVKPHNADMTTAEFETTGDFGLVANSLSPATIYDERNSSGELIGKAYSVQIKSNGDQKESSGMLKINFGNGRYISTEVVTVIPFASNNLVISTSTPSQSSAVGFYQSPYSSGEFKVAVALGSSINFNIGSNGSKFNAVYSYYSLTSTESGYEDFENFNVDELSFAQTTNIISSTDLSAFGLISGRVVGKTIVKIVFSGKNLVNSQTGLYKVLETSPQTVTKYFYVEVYNPIKTYQTNKSKIILYSYESVGFYNSAFATDTVKVLINEKTLGATYSQIQVTDSNLGINTQTNPNGRIKVEKVAGSLNEYRIFALTTDTPNTPSVNEITGQLIFTSSEFGKTYTTIVQVTILRAEKVAGIVLNNVNEEDGIYMDASSLSSVIIDATVSNNNAFNKKMKFFFEEDIGVSNTILNVNADTGLVSVKTPGQGGTGYIVVAPQDVFVERNGQVVIEDVNNVVKRIRIIVADGRTRETSYQIISLSQITDFTAHYTLISDVSVPAEWTTQNNSKWLSYVFTGGLYGKALHSDVIHTITNNVNALFNKIGQGGVVEDLVISGSITGSATGFVANENSGTIRNVAVDTYLIISTYSASSLKNTSSAGSVGGLVGINNAAGLITNSVFYGKVEGRNSVGGIAGLNSGTISFATVEFYTYEKDAGGNTVYGHVISTHGSAGGLVGRIDSTTSRIYDSYVYSYHNYVSVSGLTNSGALIGIATAQNSIIARVFARTSSNRIAGNYELTDLTEIDPSGITNAYIYSYTAGSAATDKIKIVAPNSKIIHNPRSIYQDFSSFYAAYGMTFLSTTPWAISVLKNNGYPYLRSILQETAPTDLLNIRLQSLGNVLVDNVNNYAVFFLYEKAQNLTTTAQENAVIRNWNTISFTKLFGITNPNGLRMTSTLTASQTKLFDITTTSLIVGSAGVDVTLTIFSKYDYSIKKTYTVSVYYAINNFAFLYHGEELDNSAVVNIKKGSSDVFIASYKTNRVAIDRKIELRQSNFAVKFADEQERFVIPSSNVVFSIDTKEFSNTTEWFTVSPFVGERSASDYVNALLKKAYSKTFGIATYQGASSLDVNVSEIIRMMSSDSISFTVEMVTDDVNISLDKYEKINVIVTDLLGNKNFSAIGASYNYLFENGVRQSGNNVYFDGHDMATRIDCINLNNGFYKLVYKVRLNISSAYLDYNFNELELFLRIESENSSTVYREIKVILESQSINTIFVTSHEYKGDWMKGSAGGYAFETEPNNVITPGGSALLNISLFPEYASYQYIEITSSRINSEMVIMNLMKVNEVNPDRYTRLSTGFTAITNGIRISKSQADILYGQNDLAKFFILATIPYTVSIDTVFVISIKAFNSSGEEIKSTEFNLITRPLISAGIEIEGQDKLLMARGTEAEVVVTVQLDQELAAATISAAKNSNNLGEVFGVSLGRWTETIDNAKNVKKYTFNVFVSEIAQFINSPVPTFYINAVVRRKIGGIFEEKTTSVQVTVVDFLIDGNTIRVKNDSINENVIETYVGLSKSINFTFNTTQWTYYGATDPELDEAIVDLEKKVAGFLQYNYFFNEDPQASGANYIVNYHVGDTKMPKYKNLLNNLYYVNSNGTTTKVLSENGVLISNDIISFEYAGNGISSTVESGKAFSVVGLRTGSQVLRLILSILTPLGTKVEYTYDFTVNVTVYTDEDKPIQITSTQDFLDMQNQSESQDYILMNDIELTNYTPFETSKIRSLDGNNKVITIRSFNLTPQQQSNSISLALFTTVASMTTLKNITVNYYHLNSMVINTATYKTISFAGFAITNNGIITNSHVLAFKTNSNLPTQSGQVGLILNYSTGNITSGITSTIAGFVINNNANGSITNSRVGGTEFEIVNGVQIQTGIHRLGLFTISGQGNIAGFIYTNAGYISSSYTNNIGIANNTLVGKETITSGFAGFNSGNIVLSYSKGAYSTSNQNEVRTTGSGLATSSVGAGFVYDNSGLISDSYSNIMIKDIAGVSGRYGAGFVYKNTGKIDKAYASSIIENSKTTQMNFSGVDDKGNLLNTGTIINSYYYNPDDSLSGDMEEEYSSGVLRIDSFTNSEVFYGFSFANINSLDGVWVMTSSKGPDLISANEIAISSRYLEPITDTYVMPYLDGYEYGSDRNPIIIRTAQEFNNVFGNATSSSISRYFDLDKKSVFGNYRIVANIDFSTLASSQTGDYKLISSEMKLTKSAVVDGNGLTLSNLELVSSVTNQNKFYGLFASLEDFSIVKNINISLIGVSASNIQHVGTVAGAIENSKIVNVAISSQNSNSSALVLGQNIVGGVVGLVTGDSALVSLSALNISVTADYFNQSNITRQSYSRKDKLSKHDNPAISYAGGIVGILDLYTAEFFTVADYSQDKMMSFAQASALHVAGRTQIRSATAGGVAGYVGINTSVRNAEFEITEINGLFTQKIISYKYSAGGVIGESYGDVTQSKIEHSYNAQMQIERNLNNYYMSSASRGHDALFTNDSGYTPLFIGGLIGQIMSGKISNSYAKVNVIASVKDSQNPLYIGGVVGAIGDYYYSSSSNRQIGITVFEEVYAFGSIRVLDVNDLGGNKFSASGGIAGFIEYIPSGEKINSSNIAVSITFDGVNAVTYFDKNLSESELSVTENNKTMKYVFDFYGYTNKNKNFINSDFAEIDEIFLLTNTPEASTSDPLNYVMSDLILGTVTYAPRRSYYIIQTDDGIERHSFTTKIISLKEIISVAQDASYMDIVFRNNRWDAKKWERKDGELLPRIVFTVSTSIHYIKSAEDFNLMAMYPDHTFIITPNGANLNGSTRVLIDMSSITNTTLEAIRNFRGVLKGYMPPTETPSTTRVQPIYGITNLKNRSLALIESATNGAIFADFIIDNSGNSDMTEGALLVGTASGAVFRNIILNNIIMKSSEQNVGILTSTAKNSMFDTIDVIHNLPDEIITLTIKKNKSAEIYSAGLIAGTIESTRRTTFKEITIQMKSSLTRNYGIAVSSSQLNDAVIRTVNIGGYFGSCLDGEVNISSKQAEHFISKFGISFSGYPSPDKDYFVINAGAIGGLTLFTDVDLNYNTTKNASVSFNITGQFKSASTSQSTAPAVAVGGLFGVSNGLQVEGYGSGDDRKTTISSKITIKNTYQVSESDISNNKEPNIYVGGVVGYTNGSLKIQKINIENQMSKPSAASQSNVDIEGRNNSLYLSALVGFASGDFTVDNVIVNSGFYATVNKNLTSSSAVGVSNYFGDAVAFFSNSSDSSFLNNNYTVNIQNSYFFGRYDVANTSKITYGGVIGAGVINTSTQTGNRNIHINVIGGSLNVKRIAGINITAGGIIGNSHESSTSHSKTFSIKQNTVYGDINLSAGSMSLADEIYMGGIAGRGDNTLSISDNNILTTLFSTRTTLNNDKYQVKAVVGNSAFEGDISTNKYSSQVNLATQYDESDNVSQNLTYIDILSKITNVTTILQKQFSDPATTNDVLDENGTKLLPYTIKSASEFTTKVGTYSGNASFRTYYRITEAMNYSNAPIKMDGTGGKFNKAIIADGKTITLTGSGYRLFDVIDSQSFVSGVSLRVAHSNSLNYTVLASTALYPAYFDGQNYSYRASDNSLIDYSKYNMYGSLSAVNEGVIFGSGVSGLNNSSSYEVNNENAQKLNAKFILNDVNLAGGLVALNKGYIADSFANVEITNLTGKMTDKPLSLTAGFVAINQGDIESSYSSGVINALYGQTYAFGSDKINEKYNGNPNYEPSVRKSFTIAQSSKALQEVNETGEDLINYAGVFGEYADNTNFYDVYATQTASKQGAADKYITKQISKLQTTDIMSKWTTVLEYSNFDYSLTDNFGYPSFQKAYKDDAFKFMRQATSIGNDYILPSLGRLQQLSALLSQNTTNTYNLYLINDMQITSDMGFVSNRISECTNQNVALTGSWDSFALSRTNIYGNDYTISNFSVITNLEPVDVGVTVTGNNKKQIINNKLYNGFFTTAQFSSINNLILADGQVTLVKAMLDSDDLSFSAIGGFFGAIYNNTEIKNSKNLGVTVLSNQFGDAGGIAGTDHLLGSYGGSSSKIENTINTGNVLSIWSDATTLPNVLISISAGGIIGNFNSSKIINNQNYGLILAEQIINDNFMLASAAGMGNGTWTDENLKNASVGNANFGEVRVQETKQENGVQTIELHDDQAYNLFKNISSQAFTVPASYDNTTSLPSVGDNPMLIYNSVDLTNLSDNPSGKYLLMKNISVGKLSGLRYVNQFSGTLYGNEKLISYFGYLKTGTNDNADKNGYTFINIINSDSSINNLRILGTSQNAQDNVSILSNANNGTIYETNTYGAIIGTIDYFIDVNDKLFIAGMVVDNQGMIKLSSNYALLKGTSGLSSTNPIKNGYSANNIGGLVGKTSSDILYSGNYGALIGGDGGNGFDGSAGSPGKAATNDSKSTPGTNGIDGTHGGNASTIGGLAVYTHENQNLTVTGFNKGILIGGAGGNGGKGGKGGKGGDSNIAAGDAVKTQSEIQAGIVGAASIAAGLGAWAFGPLSPAVYGISVGAVTAAAYAAIYLINEKYFDDIDFFAGNTGGVGGAGGNGGNTVVSDLIGINNNSNNNITNINSNAVTYKNNPGLGGAGGNGGNGGEGLQYAENTTLALLMLFNYDKYGAGAGAGGAGYSGNTMESLTNLQTDSLIFFAESGVGRLGGEGSVYGGNAYGEEGGSGNVASYINSNYTQTDNGIGVNPIKLTTDEDGNYLINSWDELKFAIKINDHNKDTNLKYVLQKEFLFGDIQITDAKNQEKVSDEFRSLPTFIGTITGGAIKIKGSYEKLNIVRSLSEDTKFDNVQIDLNITNYKEIHKNDLQFISDNYLDFINSYGNVILSGNITSTYTLSEMQILAKNIPASNFTWTYKPSSFSTGTGQSGNPFIISNQTQWDEFSTLVNMGSTHYFELQTTITLQPALLEKYHFMEFKAHLSGNANAKIMLGQYYDESEWKAYKYNAFTNNNIGTISNVQFGGIFANASIAQTNSGTISGVTVFGSVTSSNQLAGIAIENYGTIQDSVNNANLTSQAGAVAGITISNYGLIKNVSNNGDLQAGNGYDAHYDTGGTFVNATGGNSAAGIAIYNGFNGPSSSGETQIKGMTDVHNTGKITAGDAGDRTLGGEKVYGGYAAGIVVFNIILNIEYDAETQEQTIYIYKGLIISENGHEISNTGAIKAGKGSNPSDGDTGGNAGKIIASHIIEFEEIQYTGDISGTFVQNGSAVAGSPGGTVFRIEMIEGVATIVAG